VRSLGPERVAIRDRERVPVVRAEPVASADGVEVQRVLELGEPAGEISPAALASWTASCVGYLAGLGEGALEMTVAYVRQRRAFGSTLAALGPVQQLLADAATAVTGVKLLAGGNPDGDALAHAGAAVAGACAACHQVTGAIGFTLEYPLHRYTQRARALAVWGEALLDQRALEPLVAP
jgi:alkylation response protein AidB-like acyl-CoA dehydrogenase